MSRQHASSSCAWMLGVVQAPSFFPRCLGRGANYWVASAPTELLAEYLAVDCRLTRSTPILTRQMSFFGLAARSINIWTAICPITVRFECRVVKGGAQ